MTMEQALGAYHDGWLVSNGEEVFQITAVQMDKNLLKLSSLERSLDRICGPEKYYHCDARGRKLNEW